MDVHPKKLARSFVQKYSLKSRRIPKLTDDIEMKMKNYREKSKRKRFALHVQRRRNFLARWKTTEQEEESSMDSSSSSSPSNNKNNNNSSRSSSSRQQSIRNRTTNKNSHIRPVIGKLHVHIAVSILKRRRASAIAYMESTVV